MAEPPYSAQLLYSPEKKNKKKRLTFPEAPLTKCGSFSHCSDVLSKHRGVLTRDAITPRCARGPGPQGEASGPPLSGKKLHATLGTRDHRRLRGVAVLTGGAVAPAGVRRRARRRRRDGPPPRARAARVCPAAFSGPQSAGPAVARRSTSAASQGADPLRTRLRSEAPGVGDATAAGGALASPDGSGCCTPTTLPGAVLTATPQPPPATPAATRATVGK